MGQKKYARSFLNYPGGKYRIISELLHYFPTQTERFVDLFAGSGVVVENYDHAKEYVANDAQKSIVELQEYLKEHTYDESVRVINQIIREYHLSNTFVNGYAYYHADSSKGLAMTNKTAYLKLRADYRSGDYPYPRELMLYTLILYSFNNQVRYNKQGQFNNPVGKRDFNRAMQRKLLHFVEIAQSKDLCFTSKDFRDVEIIPDSFIYADPPYLITTAVYNENGGWNAEDDQALMTYLDEADRRGAKFAMSNVIEHKGRYNEPLIQWAQKYHLHHIQNDYSNANYHTKRSKSDEVLITNY